LPQPFLPWVEYIQREIWRKAERLHYTVYEGKFTKRKDKTRRKCQKRTYNVKGQRKNKGKTPGGGENRHVAKGGYISFRRGRQ
jgi:hypothetical protein